MATFKASEAENYGGRTGGSGFFSIDTNHGTKKIRIMYDSIDDVEGMSVHKVKVNGKDRYVNCLRNYDDPLDKCPFCRDKVTLQARLFIPIYNVTDDEVQVWDRGKQMFQKMSSLCSRFAEEQPLVSTLFDVERVGEPNDKKTTYEFYNVKTDNTTFDDLPELPKVLGGIVLDKTAEDMEEYLRTKEFPSDDEDDSYEEERPRRRSSSEERTSSSRRTPSRREERF